MKPVVFFFSLSIICGVVADGLERADVMGHQVAPILREGAQEEPLPAPETTNGWTALGPFGGDAQNVAVSVVNADIAFVGIAPEGSSGGTLYRSVDGGATWVEVPGLNAGSTFDIEFAPDGTVFIGTDSGVWMSGDDGLNWTQLDIGLTVNMATLDVFIDPNNSATIWAGISDHGGFQDQVLHKSVDGGVTWGNVTPPLAVSMACRGIAVNPADSNSVFAVFAGAFGGGEVWFSENGGSSWLNRSSGLPGNPLNAVVHDGTRILVGGGLLFGGQEVGIYASADNGLNWSPLHEPEWPIKIVNDIELAPGDPTTILVGTAGSGVHLSTDGGATWTLSLNGTGQASVNSVRFAPGTTTTVFVGASSLCVLRSTDGGVNFGPSSTGISLLDVWDATANPLDDNEIAVAFQGLNDGGVYSSIDGGLTWTPESAPPTRYSVVHFAADGTLYAVSDGPSSIAPEGLYRREAGGLWTSLGPDQGIYYETDALVLRISTDNPSLFFLGGSDVGVAGSEATVWRSPDAGATWVKVYESADENEVVTDIEFVQDHSDSTLVASFTDDGTPEDAGALRSTDGGLSWVKSSTGLHTYSNPLGLCASRDDINTFFLGSDYGTSLFVTTDAGLNWNSTGYVGAGVVDVVCDPDGNGTIYIATKIGAPMVMISTDSGATFSPLDDGLPASGTKHHLRLSEGNTDRLILATLGGAYTYLLSDSLFEDGFESGDTSAWSQSVP